MGVIDPSVLRGVGEIFAFAVLYTVIEALHKGSDVKISKGDVNVEIQNPDGDEK
jgi:hypothetical protein